MFLKIVKVTLSLVLILGLMPTTALATSSREMQSNSSFQEEHVKSNSSTEPVMGNALEISAKSIEGATVSGIEEKAYTGSAITQSPVIKDGDTTLQVDRDYDLYYESNIYPGTAKVIISGKGNYKNYIERTFSINSFPSEGMWGECAWKWDDETKTMTVFGGRAGLASDAPWYYGKWSEDCPNGGVKHIVFKKEDGKKVTFPEDSSILFGDRRSNVNASFETFDFWDVDTSHVTRFSDMFIDCNKVGFLNLARFNTENATDISGMFQGCNGLFSLIMASFDTRNVTNMSGLFNHCTSLTSLDLSNFNTTSVEDMSTMFNECTSLFSLDLSSFDTGNVEDMGGMFYSCSSLKHLNISSFDTSNVSNMDAMFTSCSSLEDLDLTNFNTGNVTNMSLMFSGCRSLRSLDLSSFNTLKVNNFGMMFRNCASLTLLDLSKFTIANNATINNMFDGCSLLEYVSLGSGITKMDRLPSHEISGHTDWFSYVAQQWFTSDEINQRLGIADTYTKRKPKSIENLDISNIANKTYTGSAITQSPVIKDGDKTLIEERDYIVSYQSNISVGTAKVIISGKGYYYRTIEKEFTISPKSIEGVTVSDIEDKPYTGSALTQSPVIKDGDTTLQVDKDYDLYYESNIYPGTAKVIISGKGNYENYIERTFSIKSFPSEGMWGECAWKWDDETKTMTVFGGRAGLAPDAPWYYGKWFEDCPNGGVKHIVFKKEDGKRVTFPEDSSRLFGEMNFNCKASFESFDFSGVDTVNVTCFDEMFFNCGSLTSLDLSFFDTHNATSMMGVFQFCFGLSSLNISTFDTRNTTSMAHLFEGCESLVSLNLANFITANVEDMELMFNGCTSLSSLTISSFNTGKVKNMGGMFAYCSSLKSLNISSFVTSNVTNMNEMFSDCSSLTSLNLAHFDTRNVTEMRGLFWGCSSIRSLDLSSFNTEKIKNFMGMFCDCISLESLDLSSFTITKDATLGNMFDGCFLLEHISLGAGIAKLNLLPSHEIRGHSDWYSYEAQQWFTSDEINQRLGIADTYTKSEPKSIENLDISNIANKTYTGSPLTQSPLVMDGMYELQENIHYSLTYENNINTGIATVIITGKGAYIDSVRKEFTIIPKPIKDITISLSETEFAYDGVIHIPTIDKISDPTLQEGRDFIVNYSQSNPIKVGTYSLWLEGRGNYQGSSIKADYVISDDKPQIIVQPVKVKQIMKGNNKPVVFSIKAKSKSGRPLTYQWYKGGTPIKGATKSTLIINKTGSLKSYNCELYCIVSEKIGTSKVSVKSKKSTLIIKNAVSFAQMMPKGKTSLVMKWNKESAADGYDIFFTRCNHGKTITKWKKIKTIKNNKTITYTKTNLRANTCYKTYVRPYKMIEGKKLYLSKSHQAHVYTNGGNKTFSDPKRIVLSKTKVSIKRKKSAKLNAKVMLTNPKKKTISKGHTPVVRYVSDNVLVATVGKTGKIKGVAKGICTIYAITQNGLSVACKVTVS